MRNKGAGQLEHIALLEELSYFPLIISNMDAVTPVTCDPRIGTGDWDGFSSSQINLEQIFAVCESWRASLHGIDKPWLCWNVSDRWCQLQQRLIQRVGWTPVVGFDPRVGVPPMEAGAVLIDFNKDFGFPVMWPQFPLEFAFKWINRRLAFWHADLLCRYSVMDFLVALFDSLEDGEMAAVVDRGGTRNALNFKSHRFWEVCGCTTQAASENQFYNGTGWWRHFGQHIKCPLEGERAHRRRLSYDSGVGIYYWQKHYRGTVKRINARLISEGHCSETTAKHYKEAADHKSAFRDLRSELDMNYDISQVARHLGIQDLLP